MSKIIREHLRKIEEEIRKADKDAYLKGVFLEYRIIDSDDSGASASATFASLMHLNKIDIRYVKRKLMDATGAEEVDFFRDDDGSYVFDSNFPKEYPIRVDVKLYLERGKEPLVLSFMLKSYIIEFMDYKEKDGIGIHIATSVKTGKMTGGLMEENDSPKARRLQEALAIMGVAIELPHKLGDIN